MSRAHLFLFALIALFPGLLMGQSIPIAQARALPSGSLVTVRGLVTNGAELGKVRYMQDHSAGIALFPGSGSQAGFESTVKMGDSLEVKGYLTVFSGLLEISPILTYQVISSNRPLPAPKPVTLNNLNKDLESQLVSVDCLSFSGAPANFSNTGTYAVSDPVGNSSSIYLINGHPILGQPVPAQPVRIQAILSVYGNFQLLPRSMADFGSASCFYFTTSVQQADIQQHGFRLNWKTNLPGTARLFYGASPSNLDGSLSTGQNTSDHSIFLNQLQAGSIYWVQAQVARGPDTVYSNLVPFATRSTSSGQIKVYFNQGIDAAAANGLVPNGTSYSDVLAETLNRINSAQQTIDVAIYNNNRNDLTTALKAAQTRGLRVRYIAAEETGNTALSPAPNFPVLYGNSSALMHNKFMAIDANLPDKAWVMSGSLNWTNDNMIQDYNNTLFIQDQSLARTYELEFQEMWGSSGALPDAGKSRFGNDKKDNTPHQFIIDSREVECYFSPSDQVTDRIVSAIQSTDYQASFAIFTFTKNEIGAALVAEHQSDAWVRGIVENTNDIGAEYPVLLSNGLPIKNHPAGALLHHKYGVFDAGYPASVPTVVTGSHNWTQAAESSNDENTLIIHDSDIATLFQAEFERRWLETGTSTHTEFLQDVEVYPNPVQNQLFLRHRGASDWNGTVKLRDVHGREVFRGNIAGPTATIDLHHLPAGSYFVYLITNRGISTFPIQTIPKR